MHPTATPIATAAPASAARALGELPIAQDEGDRQVGGRGGGRVPARERRAREVRTRARARVGRGR